MTVCCLICMMHMMYMMNSMMIDTPLMTPTTTTIDIMMIMVPYSLNRSIQIRPGAYEGDAAAVSSMIRNISSIL